MNPDIEIVITDEGVSVEVSKDLHLENSEKLRRWWVALSQSKVKSYRELGNSCKRLARIEFELSR